MVQGWLPSCKVPQCVSHLLLHKLHKVALESDELTCSHENLRLLLVGRQTHLDCSRSWWNTCFAPDILDLVAPCRMFAQAQQGGLQEFLAHICPRTFCFRSVQLCQELLLQLVLLSQVQLATQLSTRTAQHCGCWALLHGRLPYQSQR